MMTMAAISSPPRFGAFRKAEKQRNSRWSRRLAPVIRPPVIRQWSDEKFQEIARRMVMDPKMARSGDFKLVTLDARLLDAAFAQDGGSYIGPGGSGNAIGNRYARFIDFVNDPHHARTPLEAPTVTFRMNHATGRVMARFEDGRHRFAVLRDHGMTRMPVAVRTESLPLLRQMGRRTFLA